MPSTLKQSVPGSIVLGGETDRWGDTLFSRADIQTKIIDTTRKVKEAGSEAAGTLTLGVDFWEGIYHGAYDSAEFVHGVMLVDPDSSGAETLQLFVGLGYTKEDDSTGEIIFRVDRTRPLIFGPYIDDDYSDMSSDVLAWNVTKIRALNYNAANGNANDILARLLLFNTA